MIPLVSIITPVLNAEKYIRKSLDSALDQTFKDYELIIAEDGSTDSSRDIILEYVAKDKRVRFINDSVNIRIPRRRNMAIMAANGKYILIHDADDISLPHRLEVSVNKIESGDFFCVGGHAERIDLDGNRYDPEEKDGGFMRYPPEHHVEIVRTAVQKCMNPIIDPTTLFRRQDFLELGEYTLDTVIYTVPDFDLWAKAILTGRKFHNLQEPLIQYRVNPLGMTGKHKREMIRAHMIVWRKFVRDYQRMVMTRKELKTSISRVCCSG